MTALLRSALMAAALLFVPGLAAADVGKDVAEEMVRKSGLWESLGSMSRQMRSALEQDGSGSLSSPERDQFARVIDGAYAPARLRATAVAEMARALSPSQLPELRAWHDSPRGKAITDAEEAMSRAAQSSDDIMRDGTRAYAAETPRRQALFARLSKATHAAEALANLTINTTLAMQQGLISAQGQQVGPSPAELRTALTAQRPRLMQAFAGIVLAGFSLTYAAIGDEDLEAYANFLEGRAGARFIGQCLLVFDRALTQAGRELGHGLPSAAPKAKT